MMTTDHLLPYLAPPLLGAFIGYVTNYIAIRMLFRPLKPWRIFGVRLPLTPGIIPSKRHELAEKMGDDGGQPPADLRGRRPSAGKEGFRRESRAPSPRSWEIFSTGTWGRWSPWFPSRYRGRFRDLIDLLRWRRSEGRLRLSGDRGIRNQTAGVSAAQGARVARPGPGKFSDSGALRGAAPSPGRAPFRISALGGSREGRRRIHRRQNRAVAQLRPHPSAKSSPTDLIEVILGQLEKEIPPLLEKFGGLLYDPEFRERLVEKGKEGIENFLDSLGGSPGC